MSWGRVLMKEKILLLEGIHNSGADFLVQESFHVDQIKEALSEGDLVENLKGVSGVGIRSKTYITSDLVQKSLDLQAVGAFCIGTNQIDLKACTLKGIPVFNAPYSNTRSVAELVLCEVVALSRKLSHISSLLHQGVWQKKAEGSFEVRGKTIGIIGYGHIGIQVGLLAEAFGMKVLFYDISKKLPLGNASSAQSMKTLLTQSDFVTLHVPETPQTKNMMGKKEIQSMKKSAYLINASRGTVVDIEALSVALKEGHVAGAAIDVYPKEPRKNGEGFESDLLGLENVILTPHIGGSTEEAQKSIGQEVSLSLQKYFSLGDTMSAVNFPRIRTSKIEEGTTRLAHIHENKPGVLGRVNSLISDLGVNITYQSLATLDEIGYLILDFRADKEIGVKLIDALTKKESTVKVRLLG